MDCPSISPLSLYSQTESHNLSRFFKIKSGLFIEFHRNLSIIPIHSKKSFSFHPKTHLQSLSKSTQSPLLQKPISNSLEFQSFSKTQTQFFKSLAEKVAILVFGSLLFMGRFSCRPALALSTEETSSSSATMEEKKDTQNEKSDDVDEEMYLKILEKNPRDVDALKVVLYRKMRRGKTKEAVKYVERLIEIEPDDVEWRLLQALSYEMMGNLSKAKRLFKDILKERPLLLRALHGLAMVMHKNNEDSAVFDMLDKALEVSRREKRVTEERNIRILIAQMHVVKGKLEEGLKKFQVLVDENPRDFRPYLCQGIIYSLLDKKKEADEQFETYRSLVPDEFPQRGFLDDVVLEAKTNSYRLEKEFQAQFSNRKYK